MMRRGTLGVLLLIAGCGAATEAPRGDDEATPAASGSEGEDTGWRAPAGGPTSGGAVGERLLAEAQRELTALDPSTSFYAHHTYVDEATRTRQVDCSGFVDYALSRIAPEVFAQVAHPEHRRPLAVDYYRLFAGAPTDGASWRRIVRVEDLRPGDLIAWLRTPDARNRDTGHVMLVLAAPSRSPSGEWLVRVMDSSMSGHADDTRPPGQSGLGQGVIGLLVADDGHPTAFHWSGGRSHRAHVTDIAMGRAP